MDPTDRVDFLLQLGAMFEAGEKINEATIVLSAEAIALGLTLLEDAEHGPAIVADTNILMWFEIDPALWTNAAFNAGVNLPFEITLETDADPPRRYQRTMAIKVMHL